MCASVAGVDREPPCEPAAAWPDMDSVPVRRPRTTAVPLARSVGLYDEVGHALFMLNASAAAIWDRCDAESTFGEIVVDLARQHGVDPADIRDDVWQTLRMLAGQGLVRDLRD